MEDTVHQISVILSYQDDEKYKYNRALDMFCHILENHFSISIKEKLEKIKNLVGYGNSRIEAGAIDEMVYLHLEKKCKEIANHLEITYPSDAIFSAASFHIKISNHEICHLDKLLHVIIPLHNKSLYKTVRDEANKEYCDAYLKLPIPYDIAIPIEKGDEIMEYKA